MAIKKNHIKKIFFHIGNGRTFSTTFQYFLSKGNNKFVNYYGINPSKKINQWYESKWLANLLNIDLRYSTNLDFLFKIDKYKKKIDQIIKRSEKHNLPLWLSSENIGTKYFMEEIDPSEKISRVNKLFQNCEINFVLFTRNIYKTLISIYIYYVKLGYQEDFKFFCSELIDFAESNFLPMLLPGHQIESLFLRKQNKISIEFVEKESDLTNVINKYFPENTKKNDNFNQTNRTNINPFESLRFNNEFPLTNLTTGLIETHRYLIGKNNYNLDKFYKLKHFKNRKINGNKEIDFEIPEILIDFINSKKKKDKELLVKHKTLKYDKNKYLRIFEY